MDDLYSVNKHLSLDFKLRLENANSNNCFYINVLIGLLICNTSVKISKHQLASYPYI